mgnify:CR=1 FL=1
MKLNPQNCTSCNDIIGEWNTNADIENGERQGIEYNGTVCWFCVVGIDDKEWKKQCYNRRNREVTK